MENDDNKANNQQAEKYTIETVTESNVVEQNQDQEESNEPCQINEKASEDETECLEEVCLGAELPTSKNETETTDNNDNIAANINETATKDESDKIPQQITEDALGSIFKAHHVQNLQLSLNQSLQSTNAELLRKFDIGNDVATLGRRTFAFNGVPLTTLSSLAGGIPMIPQLHKSTMFGSSAIGTSAIGASCSHAAAVGISNAVSTNAQEIEIDTSPTSSVRSIGSFVCRICHNSEDPDRLVSPCLCKGSLTYVHIHCLERWITTSRSTTCELCQFQYNTEQTLRYTCLQSLRIWYSRSMSRRALQEDCQMFSLLTLVAFGIIGTLLVGIQYYILQGRTWGLGRLWTKGWLIFFLLTTVSLLVYFVNIYMITRSQLSPWYRWWQSARDIKLILENRRPFPIRRLQKQGNEVELTDLNSIITEGAGGNPRTQAAANATDNTSTVGGVQTAAEITIDLDSATAYNNIIILNISTKPLEFSTIPPSHHLHPIFEETLENIENGFYRNTTSIAAATAKVTTTTAALVSALNASTAIPIPRANLSNVVI